MSPWARIPQIGQGLPASSPWSCIALCLPRLIRKCHNRGKLAISQALWFGCHLGGRTTDCVGDLDASSQTTWSIGFSFAECAWRCLWNSSRLRRLRTRDGANAGNGVACLNFRDRGLIHVS
jgi:hypothetical protein